MARPKPERALSDNERCKLDVWVNRPKCTQRLVFRARIVLAYADELCTTAVAARFGVCSATTQPAPRSWKPSPPTPPTESPAR